MIFEVRQNSTQRWHWLIEVPSLEMMAMSRSFFASEEEATAAARSVCEPLAQSANLAGLLDHGILIYPPRASTIGGWGSSARRFTPGRPTES